MARYTQASCKKCRKHQTKLFLKGAKCYSKCAIDREKPVVRGKFSGGKPRSKQSEYAVRLVEKQKARIAAGMTERPFANLFAKASKSEGQTGELFLRYLETRLDNVVRRLGFALSLKLARQLVLHKHVKVNSRMVNIPSFQVRPGDVVAMDPALKE
ncbi:MAG: 30S ribosomal protein S4, partial [Elusimicrobia bacterium]|nr:30S ribosomal protein S4 [Elusimicrobiota bacterium]